MKLNIKFKEKYQTDKLNLFPTLREPRDEPENCITIDITGTPFYLNFMPYKNGKWRIIVKNTNTGKHRSIARTATLEDIIKILNHFTQEQPKLGKTTSLTKIQKFAKKALT